MATNHFPRSPVRRLDTGMLRGIDWRCILGELGVREEFLRRKPNCPCPYCGGTDRYSFTDRDGFGNNYCRNCGPHSGIDLLMHELNLTFVQAYKKLAERAGFTLPQWDGRKERQIRKKPDYLASIRSKAEPLSEDSQGWVYLKSRSLSNLHKVEALKNHPNLAYTEEKADGAKETKYFPALLAEITDSDGNPVGFQRIYLENARKAPVSSPKKVIGRKLAGTSVKLFPIQGEILGIAEGVETAIAAQNLWNIPVWSTVSAAGLSTFTIPKGVRKMIIFADNDANFVGQREAFKAAAAFARTRPDVSVKVLIPKKTGEDWNDVLCEKLLSSEPSVG